MTEAQALAALTAAANGLRDTLLELLDALADRDDGARDEAQQAIEKARVG